MSATFSKLGPLSVGSSLSGFEPHIEELHAFFKTREVAFGSVADLKPFVDRLDSDAAFRDEIASMMRTIIYRERDGLSWAELMELLAAAVGGAEVEAAAGADERDAVRRLMVFVEGVFKARRNPGAASDTAVEAVAEPEREAQELKVAEVTAAHEGEAADSAELEHSKNAGLEHPRSDVFLRAREAEVREETPVEEPKAEGVEARGVRHDAAEAEAVLQTDLHWHVPLEDFEDRRTAERGSPAWLWVAGLCALLLAFCAGLFVRQRLIVPLRDPNTPYQAPPPEARQPPATIPPAPAAGGAKAAENTDTIPVAKSGTAVKSTAPVNDVSQLPRYMAPATIGASPAAMEARLVYAPAPSYPMMAEMTRIQGKVMVEAVVGKSGRVIRAQAISGHHLLRGAAVREVYARRYRPYLVNDRPTNVATMVTVDFRLKR